MLKDVARDGIAVGSILIEGLLLDCNDGFEEGTFDGDGLGTEDGTGVS